MQHEKQECFFSFLIGNLAILMGHRFRENKPTTGRLNRSLICKCKQISYTWKATLKWGGKQQNYKETKVFSREVMLEDAMKYLLPSSGLIFPFSLL